MANEKKKGFLGEFKEFVMRGNVLDMAVGVILATAFGKITTSLVNDVFMPFLGWIIGDIDLSQLNITLSPAVVDGAGEVVKKAVVIGIGTFLVTIIDFILVAFIVFLLIKTMNQTMRRLESLRKKEAAVEAPPAPPEPSKEEKLLTEIRDLLKQK